MKTGEMQQAAQEAWQTGEQWLGEAGETLEDTGETIHEEVETDDNGSETEAASAVEQEETHAP